ncbi:deoxyribodipyrimidine photo-lyase [Pelagibacteraceae bacterium]|nr:deoxyribodipyrimidine photo-lyase [Pelagibacteraceae bacterium]
MDKNIGIFWIREDFRLSQNPALSFVTKNHKVVNAIYIFKKKDFDNKREAQKWWIYKSLLNFKKELKTININLELIISNSYQEAFNEILKNKNFSIYWNEIYEPRFLNFDKSISKRLVDKNIKFKIFKGNILNKPEKVKKNDGTPFKVFTPFWRTAEDVLIKNDFDNEYIIKKPSKRVKFLKSEADIKEILPKKNWYKKFEKFWNPSEKEALNVNKDFILNKIKDYGENRDIPGIDGTSKISPYLYFGQINIKTIWSTCNKIPEKKIGYRKYINELGWREFSHSLINNFPEMLKGNLRKEFDKFPWQDNKKHLNAWKKGITGYPIVDAGMRELHTTGWMHNRVRMITASFLVKHLRINWKEGEKYFRNCLLDFNEANNVSGWQWVAGCGADAAPYFRIFNPILQGEKFDANGKYVKKWIPELGQLPDKFIHKPWEMETKIKNFELGKNYPHPIVNHKEAREAALNSFKKIKKN